MATIITCEECGDKRRAAYKNTKYCVRCSLLRDLTFIGDRQYDCDLCDAKFAPVSRRDKYCGRCAFGCGKHLPCVVCQHQWKAAGNEGGYDDLDGCHELHRPDVPLCVVCLRDPKLRRTILKNLRHSQRQRRDKNNGGEA